MPFQVPLARPEGVGSPGPLHDHGQRRVARSARLCASVACKRTRRSTAPRAPAPGPPITDCQGIWPSPGSHSWPAAGGFRRPPIGAIDSHAEDRRTSPIVRRQYAPGQRSRNAPPADAVHAAVWRRTDPDGRSGYDGSRGRELGWISPGRLDSWPVGRDASRPRHRIDDADESAEQEPRVSASYRVVVAISDVGEQGPRDVVVDAHACSG